MIDEVTHGNERIRLQETGLFLEFFGILDLVLYFVFLLLLLRLSGTFLGGER